MIRIPESLIARPTPPPQPSPAETRADETAVVHAFARDFAPRLRAVLRPVFAARDRAARHALTAATAAAAALRDEVASRLDGERRQALFLRLAEGQMAAEAARMARHADAEEQAGHDAASDTFLAQQVADGLEPRNGPDAVRQALANGLHEIAAFGAQSGAAAEAIAARRARFVLGRRE